jgi:hypothetical protein
MARPRKPFSQLSESQQKRKLSWYRRNQDLSPDQVKRRYNAGTLGSQKAARGKAHSYEHPEDAVKNPGKYQGYQPKKNVRLSQADRAKLEAEVIRRMDSELGDRIKYNPATPRQYVPGMPSRDLIIAVNASANELEDLASVQHKLGEGMHGPEYRNRLWYH